MEADELPQITPEPEADDQLAALHVGRQDHLVREVVKALEQRDEGPVGGSAACASRDDRPEGGDGDLLEMDLPNRIASAQDVQGAVAGSRIVHG